MENSNTPPEKTSITKMVNEYKEANKVETPQEEVVAETPQVKATSIPTSENYKPEHFQEMMGQEHDPDLVTTYEIIKLPSKGLFYESKIGEVEMEYMTAKDEDLLTTPSLIESGKLLNLLLRRKIKTKAITPEELLPGDRNALLLFLRMSSYGPDYNVEVNDPRTGHAFPTTVDLMKLAYLEIEEKPYQDGSFDVFLPMRKKNARIRLLSSGEDTQIFNKAEEVKEAFNKEFSEYTTTRLKASIVSIEDKKDRDYINRFVDAMPAGDSLAIRRKLNEVSPDVNMDYEFEAKDGFKFTALLSVGLDFFFPQS